MVAVEGMCARRGLEGQAFGQGKSIPFSPFLSGSANHLVPV